MTTTKHHRIKISFDLDLPNGFGRVDCPENPHIHDTITDGLSGPWFMRWMFKTYDQRTLEAAIYHDKAYWLKAMPRRKADRAFYCAIIEGGHSWINRSKRLRKWRRFNWGARCMAAYVLLRAFGWIPWLMHGTKK